mmetsp:Transcript_74925/g.124919  ORF Transcript_74925/g.124919 Transcript_74925/m.124919 type:complete len:252 (+) Transcript_74925:10-765(+)
MFSRRLKALRYKHFDTFEGSSKQEATALAAWLEDIYIRQLPIEERGPLRQGQDEALQAYIEELQAPNPVAAHLKAQRYRQVCSWLLCIALQYEHEEKREQCQAAAAADSTASNPAVDGLALNDSQLFGLAKTLGVTPDADPLKTLQRALQAARSIPKEQQSAPTPKTSAMLSHGASGIRDRKCPPPSLGETTFPLGFSSGDSVVDDAARVLRILHVSELRRLQDAVNDIVVCMQEYTANPKTDSRLGKVGR